MGAHPWEPLRARSARGLARSACPGDQKTKKNQKITKNCQLMAKTFKNVSPLASTFFLRPAPALNDFTHSLEIVAAFRFHTCASLHRSTSSPLHIFVFAFSRHPPLLCPSPSPPRVLIRGERYISTPHPPWRISRGFFGINISTHPPPEAVFCRGMDLFKVCFLFFKVFRSDVFWVFSWCLTPGDPQMTPG